MFQAAETLGVNVCELIGVDTSAGFPEIVFQWALGYRSAVHTIRTTPHWTETR